MLPHRHHSASQPANESDVVPIEHSGRPADALPVLMEPAEPRDASGVWPVGLGERRRYGDLWRVETKTNHPQAVLTLRHISLT